MAHGEGTLEELGKRLTEQLDTPASKDALLKTLKSLFQILSQVDQSAPDETVTAMDGCKKALFRSELVEHKNRDVKLLLAACASEIMRIEAPNVPYEDGHLKVFFELVVATFAGLDDLKSPSYDKRVHILQTFYDVKSCLLMLDLEFPTGTENIIDAMFRTFFHKVRNDHPDNVFSMMLGIMAMVINESDDDIRAELVNEILLALVKRKDSAAAKLAADLVRETYANSRLGKAILLSLTSIHEGKLAKTADYLRDNYHTLIFKIYCCAPELLSTYIPILKEELVDGEPEVRLKTVDLFGKIFTVPGDNVPKEFCELIPEFAGRFKDTTIKVRLAAMEAAKNIMLSSTAVEADFTPLTAGLETRLYDPDDGCRTKAVALLCEITKANPKAVSKKILETLALRLRDNKQSVRTVALQKLTELYTTLCSNSDVSFTADSPDWIPAKILRSVASKMHKVQPADVFIEQLFPLDLSVEGRAKRWIAIFFHSEKTDLRVFERNLLHHKQKFQSDIKTYLRLREEVEDKKSDKFHLVFDAITSSFTDPKAREYFEKLHNMKEDNILKRLRTLLNPALTYEESRKACDDLLASVGLKAPQLEFLKSVAFRCSYILFGREHVVYVLKTLKDLKAEDNKEGVTAGMTLLEELSGYFPELMEGVEEDVVALLNEKEDNDVKEKALHILARAGSTVRDRLADSRSSLDLMLETYCLEGTRKQAKHAVTAISALSADSGLKSLSVLYGHLLNRLKSKGHLPTVLQSLGCIGQIATSVYETREKDVVDFVVEDLLLREPSQMSTKSDWDSRSEECVLKIHGLKALVKSFMPNKDPTLRLNSLKNFVPVLLKLLKSGCISETKTTSDVDKAHLRLAASKAVLRLSRSWEKDLPVELYRYTIFTAQDPYVQVRKEFLAKAYQYLKPQHLAPKYATVYPLCSTDAVKEIAEDAKRYMTDFVAVRRDLSQELHSHPDFVIIYLVHLLAHHPKFPDSSADAAAYEPFYRMLFAYLQAVLVQAGDAKKESGNVSAVTKILRTIKLTEDAEDPAKSQNVYAVCDIALYIAKELNRSAEVYKGPVRLPVSYYNDIAEAPAKEDGSDLPPALTEAALGRFQSALMETSQQRKRALKKSEEVSADEAEENDDPPPKKSRKSEAADKSASKAKGGARKGAKDKETKEKEKEVVEKKENVKEVGGNATNMSEDDESPKRKRGRPNKEKPETPKAETPSDEPKKPRGRPKGSAKKQKVEAESSGEEKLETPKAKQETKAKPEKENQKTKSGDSAKKSEKQELAEVASSAKRRKSGADKTPAKREETEDEEEPAIGRRIKVWWPEDKKFYSGQVQSYNAKTKKHRIVYDDNDKETLLMTKERWEYLKEKETSPPRSSKSKKKTSVSASARDDEAQGSVQKQKSTGKKRGGERKEVSDDAQHHSENHAGRPYSKVNVNGGEAESCQSKGTDTDDDEPLASYRIRRLGKKMNSSSGKE